jgi:hypothetical protein
MGLILVDPTVKQAMRTFEEELRKRERKEAAKEMDQLREESTVAWDGVATVRRWRRGTPVSG